MQVYERLPDKNIEPPAKKTFTLGYVTGTTLLTGLVASPAFAINYLNKYITPTNYVQAIDKLSLGTAGLIGAIGALNITTNGMKFILDWIRYGSIRKKITNLDTNLNQTNRSIASISKKNHVIYSDNYEKLYTAFSDFYKNNHNQLTSKEINIFISNHSDTFFDSNASYSDAITYILKVFINEKNKMLEPAVFVKAPNNDSYWSTGNLSHDVLLLVGMVLLAPWALLFSAANTNTPTEITSNYQYYKRSNEFENIKFNEINTVDTIIKKLKTLLVEAAKDEQSINHKNPAI